MIFSPQISLALMILLGWGEKENNVVSIKSIVLRIVTAAALAVVCLDSYEAKAWSGCAHYCWTNPDDGGQWCLGDGDDYKWCTSDGASFCMADLWLGIIMECQVS